MSNHVEKAFATVAGAAFEAGYSSMSASDYAVLYQQVIHGNFDNTNVPRANMLPQLATFVLAASQYNQDGDVKKFRDLMRRMVSVGLPLEADASAVLEWMLKTKRIGHIADAKHDKLTIRSMIRLLGVSSLALLAGSMCHPSVVRWLVCHYSKTESWTSLMNDLGYDPCSHGDAVRSAIAAELGVPLPTNQQLETLAKQWAECPLYREDATPVAETTATTATTATATTGVTNMTIAPTTAAIINAVFQQAGVSTDIDTLLSRSAQLDSYMNVATEYQAEAEKLAVMVADTQRQLDVERQRAATAMPSSITLTSQSATIPDGSMGLINASAVFPELGNLSITVPSFQWDATHPDVPTVNPAYIFRKGMLISVLRCLANGDNTWLQGHTGSGKTTFIEQVAARLGWPVARVAYDSNVDRAELVGRMQLIPDGKGGTESKWLPGILERAISGGYILLCDEMDAGHPNALYTLQPLLEGKGLTLLEDGGRIVSRHPFARIVATGNTTGNGDPSGLYPACRILSAATLDRFQDFVQVPYLTEAEETNLIRSQAPGLRNDVIEKIVKFGSELRKAFVSGETPISFSPRRSVAFARHVEDLQRMGVSSEELCISVAFRSKLYDAAPEEHRQRLLEIGKAKLVGLDVEAALLEA